ncbi:MAG: LysM peptidoglycan-binding domain-containing protein, partial [Anaerolineae bacterium]|nr:LysM peptidoglycan-binding domain-containing protein [Anaerolineae bacterium]
ISMNHFSPSWKRTATTILFVCVGLALFAGWRRSGSANEATVPLITATPEGVTDTAVSDSNSTPSSLEIPILTDTSLAPAPYPHTYQGKLPAHEFETYVVERGDTPVGIAEQFGIKTETILGGNPQLSQESSLLQTGVELIILPVGRCTP